MFTTGTGIILAIAFTILFANPASAHAAVVDSNPVDGAKVTAIPAQFEIRLNEKVKPPAYLVVTDEQGRRFNSQQVTVDDKTVTSAAVATGAVGTLTMAYRIVSSDGHPVSGKITFEVNENSAERQSADSAEELTTTPSQTAPPSAADDEQVAKDDSLLTNAGTVLVFFAIISGLIGLGIRAATKKRQ